ncbi:MAG: tRNA (adenosine(37)-N6)-threonylcarbamoyltransferase complex dimerization subunit type 1 TsaB [Chitinophagaceae bacterium]|nr:tRNA (adenosine(37)-N6)-threonylcarbamoyltransferase complex dimerization subunit type 1 TsaB [Chitinophagaceae bacterium]
MTKIIGFHQPIFAIHNCSMSQHINNTILLINTALQEASVGIAVDGQLIDQISNLSQKEHASFLHPAIQSICKKNDITLKSLKAVSVINGPGSYTGLRVGLSAAKGICYANQIPLICINTLEWIAFGNREQAKDLIVPMIDARRMEVFTAVYSRDLNTLFAPSNLILDEQSYAGYLNTQQVLFVGDGAAKWQELCKHPNAQFPASLQNESHHAAIAEDCFLKSNFPSLFEAAPFYTKDFFSTQRG